MSSRAPVQVDAEIKARLEDFKSRLTASSLSDVIGRLMDFYERSARERAQERARQEETMVELGAEAKNSLTAFRGIMDLRSDADAVELLLAHYRNSDKLDKATFDLYRKLI